MKASKIALVVTASGAGILLLNQANAQYTYTTIDFPSGVGTYANGVSGNNVVGFYQSSSGTGGWTPFGVYQAGTGTSGFLYNGGSFTALNDPLAALGTLAYAIDGNNIVGYYNDSSSRANGFLYNGSSYTTLSDPLGVQGTVASGISGNNIVGGFYAISGTEGFLYNINTATYTTLSAGAATGISGNNVVGNYVAAQGGSGSFIYNISTGTYTALNGIATGISGDNIVGYYQDSGFLYNITTTAYTTLDDPLGVNGTFATGIDGNNIVGYYEDASGKYHSFEAIPVPEPSTLALACFGAFSLLAFRRVGRANEVPNV